MLSILIPVYNHEITKLVDDLHKQASQLGIAFEIIVADDASKSSYKQINRQITSLPNVRYYEMEHNMGRSKIRNHLSKLSRYDYLLFMDCDAQVASTQFVENYLQNCTGQVVCGGTAYDDTLPDNRFFLRWYYGKQREQRSADERNLNPNNSFTTFNFLIPRKIFQTIGFNESLCRYGHEDTLFGYELKRKNYLIRHIDNPLIHTGLDSNKDFVFKTKQSIKNLYLIASNRDFVDKDIFDDIKILTYYRKMKRLRLTNLISVGYKMIHTLLENQLTSKSPKLIYFDMLKLGYLCTLDK